MRREIGRPFAESTEVDDLSRASRRGAGHDRVRGGPIERLEVAAPERVDQVVHDFGPVERAAHRGVFGRIGGDPLDLVVDRRGRPPRYADDVVLRCERPHARAADRAGGSDDDDTHQGASRATSARNRAATRSCSATSRLQSGPASSGAKPSTSTAAWTPSARQQIVPPDRRAIKPPRIARRPSTSGPKRRNVGQSPSRRTASPEKRAEPSVTRRIASQYNCSSCTESSATPTGAHCVESIVPSSCLSLTLSIREGRYRQKSTAPMSPGASGGLMHETAVPTK